jgi:hypothetical protein
LKKEKKKSNKECSWVFGAFENFQNQETSPFGFLRIFKEPVGFMKEPMV